MGGNDPQAAPAESNVAATIIDPPSALDATVESLGPYELRGVLGEGAMACVWRAWDTNLEREVALKEPSFYAGLPQRVLDEMGERFVNEAKTAAKLNHPNIVIVHSADVYDGRPVIDMELVDGDTLGTLLERGPLDPYLAFDYLDQLLDAVGYAHRQGVIHRDIKPDNIFITPEGRLKLGDFGIAHVDSGGGLTRMNTVLGSPGYMSPEQAQGNPVTGQSDLFSVGVIAFEMFAGYSPFGAEDGCDSTTLMYRIVHEPPRDLPSGLVDKLPAGVQPAITAALQKDPNDRPRSAAAFKAMLNSGGKGREAPPSKRPPAAPPRKRPKWLPYVAVAAACIVALGAMGASALSGSQEIHSAAPSSSTAELSVKSSVDAYSWEDLARISSEIAAAEGDLQATQIASQYNLCNADGKLDGTQKKEVRLSDGRTVSAQIIGFGHDLKSDGGKAGISFLFDECVATRNMNGDGSSNGGWKGSELRAWLNDGFLHELPSDLRDEMVRVEKTSNVVGETPYSDAALGETSDYLWLPSAKELCGTVKWATGKKAKAGANELLNGEGEVYSLYQDIEVRDDDRNAILVRTNSGARSSWWLRSVRSSEPGCFYYVDADGKPHNYNGPADADMGIVPGFCI